MKIIPFKFKKRRKEYVLQDEFHLPEDLDGVQVASDLVRVFITEEGKWLRIKVIDEAARAEGDVKDGKGLVLSKSVKVRQEV